MRESNPPGSHADQHQIPKYDLFGAKMSWLIGRKAIENRTPIEYRRDWMERERVRRGRSASELQLAKATAEFKWPLLDIGLQFARLLVPSIFAPPPARIFERLQLQHHDPRSYVAFDGVLNARAKVRPTLFDEIRSASSELAVLTAGIEFISTFVEQAAIHAPCSLEWNTFFPIVLISDFLENT